VEFFLVTDPKAQEVREKLGKREEKKHKIGIETIAIVKTS
jgi:hypothetical protein